MLNLLLITKGKEQHYVLIKDFDKFMYNQTKHAGRKHFCMHCLQCFKSKIVLNNHKENCIIIDGAQAIKMPKVDDMVYFKSYHKELTAPFVIYANFEDINEKLHGCQPHNDKSYTESIRSINTVDMDIRLTVIMIVSIVNQFKYIEEKMLFISSRKKC